MAVRKPVVIIDSHHLSELQTGDGLMSYTDPDTTTLPQLIQLMLDAGIIAPETMTVPVNTSVPVVTGAVFAGDTASTTNGTWTGAPTNYEYKWQMLDGSWTDVVGETANTFEVEEAGEYRSAVRAQNVAGWSDWEYSAPFVVTEAAPIVAPTISGSIVGFPSGGSPNSTQTGTFTSAAGEAILVFVLIEGTSTITVSDNNGNTYTAVGPPLQIFQGAYTVRLQAFITPNISGRSGHTVTASASTGYPTVIAVRATGVDPVTPVLDFVTGTDTETPFTIGITTTEAALLVNAINQYHNDPYDDPSLPFVYVNDYSAEGWPLGVAAYRQTEAGSATASWSLPNDYDSIQWIVALKGLPS